MMQINNRLIKIIITIENNLRFSTIKKIRLIDRKKRNNKYLLKYPLERIVTIISESF